MAYEESSSRSIYSYKLLCKIKDKSERSVCDSGDESTLSNMVKDVFLDYPSTCKYQFEINPPDLDGQTGVPKIVDEILGRLATF